MRSQQAAQAHGQHALMLVVTHRDLDLEVFVGMHARGVLEMAVAQGAGFPQNGDHFILCGYQVHG